MAPKSKHHKKPPNMEYNIPIKVLDAKNSGHLFSNNAFNFESLVKTHDKPLKNGYQTDKNAIQENLDTLRRSLEINGYAFLYFNKETCKQTKDMVKAAKTFFDGRRKQEKEKYSFLDDSTQLPNIFGYSTTNNPDPSKPGDREVFRCLTGDFLRSDQWNKLRFPNALRDFPPMLKRIDEIIYKLTQSMAGPVFYSDVSNLGKGVENGAGDNRDKKTFPEPLPNMRKNTKLPLLAAKSEHHLGGESQLNYGMFDCVNYRYDIDKIVKVIAEVDKVTMKDDKVQKIIKKAASEDINMMEVDNNDHINMMKVDDSIDRDDNLRNGGKYYSVISEHVDPGLFVVNFGCEVEGLQLYDHENKSWVEAPTVIDLPNGEKSYCGVLWCGKTAQTLTRGRIKGCQHRVVQRIMGKREYEEKFTSKGDTLDRISMWFELSCESQARMVDLAMYEKSIQKIESMLKVRRRKQSRLIEDEKEKLANDGDKSRPIAAQHGISQTTNIINVLVNNPKHMFQHKTQIQISENASIGELYEKASYRISVPYSKSGFSMKQPDKLQEMGKGEKVFLDRNKTLKDYGIREGSEIFAE